MLNQLTDRIIHMTDVCLQTLITSCALAVLLCRARQWCIRRWQVAFDFVCLILVLECSGRTSRQSAVAIGQSRVDCQLMPVLKSRHATVSPTFPTAKLTPATLNWHQMLHSPVHMCPKSTLTAISPSQRPSDRR